MLSQRNAMRKVVVAAINKNKVPPLFNSQVRTHRGGQPYVGLTKKQIQSLEDELPDEKEKADRFEKYIKEKGLFKSKPNKHSEKVTKHFYEKSLTPKTKEQPTLEPPRKEFTKDDALHKLDEDITKLYRGGYDLNNDATEEFTQMLSPEEHDDADPTWRTMHEFIENVSPKAINHRAQPQNTNTSEWLFDVPPTIVNEKPGTEFSFDPVSQRRKTEYTEQERREKIKEMVMELPLFKHRPPDPFAYRPHLIERISWKNPRQLLKFCSLSTGKILNPRHTGVKLRTQNKLRKEIMKARHLGLLSHSGNPEFTNPLMQPNYENLNYEEYSRFNENFAQKNQLELYLNNLREGLVNNGTLEWQPPRHVTNPKISLKAQKAEALGHLPEQMQKKKELLIKWRIENEILKSKGLSSKKYPSQVLRELEEKEGLRAAQ